MIMVLLLFIFQIFFGVPVVDLQANVTDVPGLSVRFSSVETRSAIEPRGPTPRPEVQFNVEVADTAPERARGLMFRSKLPQNRGMLFVFENDEVRNFWMKNTLIPLDMIFVDSGGSVVSVRENVPPCDDGTPFQKMLKSPRDAVSCPIYSSGVPARYVLEINAGLAQAHAIQPGVRMDIAQM